jgi:hypothetical protein
MQPVRILALPVDGRPAVREQVVSLLRVADAELVVPPVEALGLFREPADRARLREWLIEEARNVEGLVLSIDMLVYGGLVPSRFIEDDAATLKQHLAVIEDIKRAYPKKPVYAFAATMRISNNNVNEEEKTYWAQHGTAIWRWSYYSDKYAQTKKPEDARAAEQAAASVPPKIREDYLATRARNVAVTEAVVDLLQRGVLDRLILPQDDTAEYGFNIAERRALEADIIKRKLQDRAAVYAGADEVIHTLCARMVTQLRGGAHAKSLRVFVSAGDAANLKMLHALYEDRPIESSIANQIAAVGGVAVTRIEEADVVLAVHTSGTAQGDWAMKKPLAEMRPVSRAWVVQLAEWHRAGKPIAVADLAYANGGDPRLMEVLSQQLPLNQLAAYGGWNTASNTLGSVLAQCALAQCTQNKNVWSTGANIEVRALRLLEDFVYQAEVRQLVRAEIDESKLTANERRDAVATAFIDSANTWAAAHRLGWRVRDIFLPWNRTFEIGLQLERGD